jgi:hypothetical protein
MVQAASGLTIRIKMRLIILRREKGRLFNPYEKYSFQKQKIYF